MGVHIDTNKLKQECVPTLEKCVNYYLDNSVDKIEEAKKIKTNKTVFDKDVKEVEKKLEKIAKNIEDMKTKINKHKDWINNKAEAWESAERQNISASSGISGATSVGAVGGSVSSAATNTSSISATRPSELENEVQAQTPTNTGELNQEINPELEENVPNTLVETIIELLYGENPTLTDDERQSIAEAIGQINNTGILEGLDEDTANKITSQIVKDALEGKLDLTDITAESLQEYIKTQPSININLELNKAIQNFDELIKEGQLTEEQINSVINNQVQIYDTDASFMEAYQNAGGTSEDISKVEAFYDTTTQTIHIRNTVDSTVITNSAILALGGSLFFDEITGQVILSETATDLDFDGTIEVVGENKTTEPNTQVDLNDSITTDTQVGNNTTSTDTQQVDNNNEVSDTQADINNVIDDTQTKLNRDTNISE